MCDTIVALGSATADGRVLFAKNSDREPNEAHELVIIPRAKHQPGSMVKCTYIEIPQVEETYQVLLAKPFWIWGAEMGSNEYGVTIGNEAVFTRDPYGKEPGLIGMDFLRLALERTKSAHAALMLIIELLEKYGQSGNCGFAHKMFYHNSFLICDAQEAWVLETSSREWAAIKVKTVGSISNAITIEKEWDLASKGLVSHALEKGWCKDPRQFSFSRCYSEPVFTLFSDARRRQSCTSRLLLSQKGCITPAAMMSILRNHADGGDPDWAPHSGITGADVCMHAGWGPIRGSQSAGSMVSQIDPKGAVHWLTGTAAPCTSLFKPVWLDCGIPLDLPAPTGIFDNTTLYWKHEAVHRAILRDYAVGIAVILNDQKDYEAQMLESVGQNLNASSKRRAEISKEFFDKAQSLEIHWADHVGSLHLKSKGGLLYRSAWKRFNDKAAIDWQ